MAYQDLYTNYGAVNSMFSPEEDTSIDMQANVKPVTQTIKTDPITGEQKMTITGRPEDLSATNPLTPTVTMPGQGLRMPTQPQGQGIQMPREMADVAMPAFTAPIPAARPAAVAPVQAPTPPEEIIPPVAQPAAAPVMAPAVPATPPQPQMPPSQAGGFLGATEDLVPAAPVAPAAPIVAPATAFAPPAPATAPVAPAPVAAESPEYTQRMLSELRKREGNYDSPAHALSSARGAYGITAPAYSDIQRADPYFAQRDQATLTPADQDRAALVLRGLNQQRLRAQGVDPTEENQQLAHFLGPKGAADYLATGYISDAAAAANGGLEKTRQIAEERLAFGRSLSGQAGPAVAGVGREMGLGEPGYGGAADQINDLAARGDRQGLANMMSQGGLTGRAAGMQLNQQMTNEQREAAARNKLQSALETGDQRDLFNMLKTASKKTEEGSWITYLITGLLGMEGPNRREADKLGLNDKTVAVTLADGTAAMIQMRGDKPVAGITDKGLMNQKELLAAAPEAVGLGKGVHINKTETYIDPESGQIVSHQTLSNGKERYTVGGRPFTGDATRLVPEKQFSAAEDRRVNTALESLRRNVPNPTQAQVQQALVTARIPNRRIEQEMGLAPGSLGGGAGRTSAGGAMPPTTGGAMPPTTGGAVPPTTGGAIPPGSAAQPPAAAGAQPPAATQITPDVQPEPPVLRDIRPGERKDQYDAYVKAENDAYKKRLDAFQNRVKKEQEEAQAFRNTRFETRSVLDSFRKGAEAMDSGAHNLGPNFSLKGAGVLPTVKQWFGTQIGTDASANTTKILSMINRDGLQGIKNSMGPAISNFDVQTWMANNPIKPNSPPEEIKKWLIKTHDAMLAEAESKRQTAAKHGMVEPSFDLGKPLTGATAGTNSGTTSTGIKWNRAQ